MESPQRRILHVINEFYSEFRYQTLIVVSSFHRIIAKGAGGGLGSGGVSSSRGTIVSSVLELHKDEEIHILVGQSGENACIRSMGFQDDACAALSSDTEDMRGAGHNIRRVNDMYIENGGGGT